MAGPSAQESVEEQVDAADWELFRQLRRTESHWYWRPGWHAKRRYLTWYVLFGGNASLASFVDTHAQHLDLPYLDLIPPLGLHMTIQGVGFADEVDMADAAAIAAHASAACAGLGPFPITLGPLAGYEGGVFLRAGPWAPMVELRRYLRDAIGAVLGREAVPAEPVSFKPHVSVAYANATVPVGELVARVQMLRELPRHSVTIGSVALIELRREGRSYRWDVLHEVALAGP